VDGKEAGKFNSLSCWQSPQSLEVSKHLQARWRNIHNMITMLIAGMSTTFVCGSQNQAGLIDWDFAHWLCHRGRWEQSVRQDHWTPWHPLIRTSISYYRLTGAAINLISMFPETWTVDEQRIFVHDHLVGFPIMSSSQHMPTLLDSTESLMRKLTMIGASLATGWMLEDICSEILEIEQIIVPNYESRPGSPFTIWQ